MQWKVETETGRHVANVDAPEPVSAANEAEKLGYEAVDVDASGIVIVRNDG